MLERSFGAPLITKDGVTVAKEIELQDKFENMGAQMVREVASKTSDTAGDGTTTATVLAQAIYREGAKNVVAGANPMELKRGIEKAVDSVVANLKTQSTDVSGKEDIARVATISSREREIGDVIADAIEKELGAKGVGVVIEAEHLCMTARGVRKPGSLMVTSAMRGRFRTADNTRQEFLRLIGR